MFVRDIIEKNLFRANASLYYALRYWRHRRRIPHFKNPSDLSEYLLAAQLKPDFMRFAPFADKIKVRDYIRSKGLSDLLPQIYQIVQDANQIDFDALPDKFVLKTNHGCGGHIVCKNKTVFDKKKAVETLNFLVKTTYSIMEPHYTYIEPVIYAEQLIECKKQKDSLSDYKFMVCNAGEGSAGMKGKNKPVIPCILVVCDRYIDLKFYVYDTNWNNISERWLKSNHRHQGNVERPENLQKMIEIAGKLGEDFEFVRVDLYDVGDSVYFSELTFTPAGGYMPYFTDFALREMYRPIKGNLDSNFFSRK
ncbi:MAG: hypothetical protein LBU03_05195 [Tannerellaceae bacterium]|jgi:hypothetical protein|nr:hypothetical protein [Tannerellaceae bacterium]